MATVEVKYEGGVALLILREQNILGDDSCRVIEKEVFKLIKMGWLKILIDFADVKFFKGEDLLPTLIALHREIKKIGGMLILCNICPETQAYQVFRITQLDKFFTIVKDVEEAFSLFPTSEKP